MQALASQPRDLNCTQHPHRAGTDPGYRPQIFISILAGKLPEHQRDKARKVGIVLAAITRLALLFLIAWVIGLTAPLFTLFGNEFSWRI